MKSLQLRPLLAAAGALMILGALIGLFLGTVVLVFRLIAGAA